MNLRAKLSDLDRRVESNVPQRIEPEAFHAEELKWLAQEAPA